MDYKSLARDYLEVMYRMRRRNTHKHINDSVHGEQFVLSYISEHDGNVIPSDISQAMGITSARIAAALNSLEKKGLISRRIDPEDRRRILIDLTAAGKEQVNKHHQMIMSYVTRMLEYLGEDDAKEYIRIMKKLAAISPEELM